jgi:hypothetical protein
MKKLPLLLLGVVFTFTANSCSSSDKPLPIVPPASTANIVATASQGTWHVTKYIDHTDDQTTHFTGYTFSFGPNNVLTATNADGTTTVTGSWNVTNNMTGDDSPTNPIDFNILFSAPPDFEDISDDWDIISLSATKIEMTDVSGSSSNTDFITFEKN